jgi:hypothetical protein
MWGGSGDTLKEVVRSFVDNKEIDLFTLQHRKAYGAGSHRPDLRALALWDGWKSRKKSIRAEEDIPAPKIHNRDTRAE